MATEPNSTEVTNLDRLSEASLEGCYLETLLVVAEDIFEDIDHLCDHLPPEQRDIIRDRARRGLNIIYMANDKAAAVKRLAGGVESALWLDERRRKQMKESAQ
jgi:hypothetical protein